MAQKPAFDLTPYLASTTYIEADAPAIRELVTRLKHDDPTRTTIALFNWVRDEIRYDPYTAMDPPEMYHATAILKRGSGYCIQKAVLLATLGRAAGIPSRLGFADVRNHKIPDSMRRAMGTDLFVFHGYVEFFLDGGWVKATPAFDAATTRKANALPVELDGTNDAMLHPVDPEGHPHIEYIRNRGSFVDLPLDEIRKTFLETYSPPKS